MSRTSKTNVIHRIQLHPSIGSCVTMALLLLVSQVQAVSAVEPSRWSTYQGSAEHAGFVDTHLRIPSSAQPLWSKLVVPEHLATAQPTGLAIANGRVFVASPRSLTEINPLVALALHNGTELWRRNFPGVDSVNPPAVADDGSVYLVTGKPVVGDAYLHRLSGVTGATLFANAIPAQWQRYMAPTIVDGQVATGGGMYAGLYSASLAGVPHYLQGQFNYDEWTPVPWKQSWVVMTDQLRVIDRATGAIQRSIPIPEYDWWGWSVHQSPIILGDVAYFTQDQRLIAIDLETEDVVFVRHRADYGVGYLDGQVVTDGDQLFVNAGTEMLVVATDGELVDAYSDSDRPQFGFGPASIVTCTHLIAWTPGDEVVMIDRRSGEVARRFPSSEGIVSMALADGKLVVATRAGRINVYAVPFYAPPSLFTDDFESGTTSSCATSD